MSSPPTISIEEVLAIQELHARYNWYVDHDHFDEWVSLFTPDGVFESAAASRGHEALQEFVRSRAERQKGGDVVNAQHWTSNVVLERDGDVLRGKCYVTRIAVNAKTGAKEVVTLGTYADELVQVSGAWRIRRRTFTSS